MPRNIVTLTSFPARIKTVHIVIDSMFRQKLKPDMIVLYLGYNKFPNKEQDLPEELIAQTTRGLSIHWVKDIGCFTTLIPALIEFPDDIIFNIDDDIYYDSNILSDLYNGYKKNPLAIHTNTSHRIVFDQYNSLLPYDNWLPKDNFYARCICFKLIDNLLKLKNTMKNVLSSLPANNISKKEKDDPDAASYHNFIISTLGTLYPPHCLHEDSKNVELAYKLSPTNDDIWFWIHAIRNGTKIQLTKKRKNRFKYIGQTQASALFNTNLVKTIINEKETTPNDIQMQNVLEYYPELLTILKSEKISKQNKLSRKYYLFRIIPLLDIFSYRKRHIIFALFGIIPLLIISKKSKYVNYNLFGFIPILKLKNEFWMFSED